MRRAIALLLLCTALPGCSATTGLSSLTNIGGGPPDIPPAKPAAAPEPASSQSPGGSGIWANFSSAFSSGAQPAAPQNASVVFDPNEALRLVNEYRASQSLSPLSLDSHATAAAEALAKDMAQHDHMSHVGPNGADIGKRLSLAGYSYHIAAENVAVGQRSIADIVEGWKNSPPHSRNLLLAQAKHMGIAYVYKPDTKYKTYWTLVVAAP
jgi:uncharacterized protein YkwD